MTKKTITWLMAGAAALAGLGALRAQSGGFRFDGLLGRIITPNGDGRNDRAIFCFENFSDSDVEGGIYTPAGSEVARLDRIRAAIAGCPAASGPQHMIWDGRMNGEVARSGVYVYQIKAEGLTFTGSILVVR